MCICEAEVRESICFSVCMCVCLRNRARVILRGFVREGKRKRDTNKKQSEAGNVSECVRAWRGGVGRNGGGGSCMK